MPESAPAAIGLSGSVDVRYHLLAPTRSLTRPHGGIAMGEVIKKNAAVVDILADLRAAYVAAKARGGVFAELGEQHLAPAIALVEPVEAELAQRLQWAEPAASRRDSLSPGRHQRRRSHQAGFYRHGYGAPSIGQYD